MDPIIVVGSGLAGYGLVRELRRRARNRPVLLVTRDSGEYYSKPALSSALRDGRTADELVLNTAEQMAASTGARIHTGTPVLGIDPARRRIRVPGGEWCYSDLVLALGASPVRPELAGDGASEVLTVNDLGDYRRFRQRLESVRKVLLLGAGLIGCEFADDLCSAGIAVEVVEPAPQALPRLLPDTAAAVLQARLAASGVRWQLGVHAIAVDREADGYRMTLSDGGVLKGDLVLSAVGLRPHTALAEAAGLRVNRGIVVDRHLAASEPGIHALGDCAEVEGLVLPYVAPIPLAARALATTLGGTPTAVHYPAMPVHVKTPSWPTIVAPAPSGTQGRWRCDASDGGMRSVLQDDRGGLIGFALNGTAVVEAGDLARHLPPLIA